MTPAEQAGENFHNAAQALADLMEVHLRVTVQIEGEGPPMGRIYHPSSCPEHTQAQHPEQPTVTYDIPHGFKGLFQ
jgi:hypothetical protein